MFLIEHSTSIHTYYTAEYLSIQLIEEKSYSSKQPQFMMLG